jgi:hypothetical protein
MSTIKSDNSDLTINASGSTSDIKFQANGVEKASISSAGAFTSTTIDATKLTGDLPVISGANLTGLPAGGISDLSPYFHAYDSNGQVFAYESTWTKLTFPTESLDSDSAYDTANYKFTVPTGKAGKYYFSTGTAIKSSSGYNVVNSHMKIYKNGTAPSGSELTGTKTYAGSTAGPDRISISMSVILDLSVGDYIEAFGNGSSSDGGGISTDAQYFSGFKIG